MSVGCGATSATTAGEHQDISRGKWGTEMYGDNYFLWSSGLSRSLVSNLQPTSFSSAHVCMCAHACVDTFLLRCWYRYFFLKRANELHMYILCASLSNKWQNVKAAAGGWIQSGYKNTNAAFHTHFSHVWQKKPPTNYRLESDDDENKRGGLNIDAA